MSTCATPLVAILGSPRSGTTFLLDAISALDRFDAVAGQIFPSQAGPLLASGVLDDRGQRAMEFAFRFALDDYVRLQERVRSRVVGEALQRNLGPRELVAGLRGRRRLRGIGYKEPFLSFWPDLVTDAVPDASCIVIHRDGRDVARSLVGTYGVLTDERLRTPDSNEVVVGRDVDGLLVPWWVADGAEAEFLGADPFVRAVWMWREMVRRLLAFETAAPAKGTRLLRLRYEDLMASPLPTAERISDFLGLTLTNRARRRFSQARATSTASHTTPDPALVEQATDLARAELEVLGYR